MSITFESALCWCLMQHDSVVFFSASPDLFRQAASAFEMHRHTILRLVPDAEVHHVGSTAMPGLLTKGDLDILVRVDGNRFAEAEALLASTFERNYESDRSSTFASFMSKNLTPPLGIQVTTKCGEFDFFIEFSSALKRDCVLLAEYARLKAAFQGRSMKDYRVAKDAFIERVLAQASVMSAKKY